MGACDAHGNQKDGLNITKHLPFGLTLFGHVNNPLAEPNLVYLCEGRTVGILYDCNNRIPLYAATVIRGSQLSGANGKRPQIRFKNSRTGLYEQFQQSKEDYKQASHGRRKVCYFKRSLRKEIVDVAWYGAKNKKKPSNDDCIGDPDNFKTGIDRGHMVPSHYVVGSETLKEATFVYTNAVPQFGDFNSYPWAKAERALVDWGRENCANNDKQNVQIFIVVGVIPSTLLGPSQTRYFGKNGFSDYQDGNKYRVNVPADMWTAACCTFEFLQDGVRKTGVHSTAFWRRNVPGTLPVKRVGVQQLERRLKLKVKEISQAEIHLFPYFKECSKSTNFISLPYA